MPQIDTSVEPLNGSNFWFWIPCILNVELSCFEMVIFVDEVIMLEGICNTGIYKLFLRITWLFTAVGHIHLLSVKTKLLMWKDVIIVRRQSLFGPWHKPDLLIIWCCSFLKIILRKYSRHIITCFEYRRKRPAYVVALKGYFLKVMYT